MSRRHKQGRTDISDAGRARPNSSNLDTDPIFSIIRHSHETRASLELTTVDYQVVMQHQLTDNCPFVGSIITLQQMVNGQVTHQADYTIRSLPPNPESQGVCVLVERTSKDPVPLPNKLAMRLPDLRKLTSLEIVRRYIEQFRGALNAELEALKGLAKVSVVAPKPLGNQPKLHQLKFRIRGLPMISAPVLLREYVGGISLKEWCVSHSPQSAFNGCNLETWFPTAKRIIDLVQTIHMAGISHGYISPENIIVSVHGIPTHLINFEREVPDPTLLLDYGPSAKELHNLIWRRTYDSPEKVRYFGDTTELLEYFDPYTPGDLFSLGLTLLYLLTGRTLDPFVAEEPWLSAWRRVVQERLKRDRKIKEEIWGLLQDRHISDSNTEGYEQLLAAEEIIFSCLRSGDHRFYNVRDVLDVFKRFKPEVFDRCAQRTPQQSSGDLGQMTERLCEAVVNKPEIRNTVVASLYRDKFQRISAPLTESPKVFPNFQWRDGVDTVTQIQTSTIYSVSSREEIKDATAMVFLHLKSSGKCQALITPAFFSRDNCTTTGRVMSAVKTAASRGACIQFLFLLNEEEMSNPSIVDVLHEQKKAVKEVIRFTKKRTSLAVGWLPMPTESYKRFLQVQKPFIFVSSKAETRPAVIMPDFATEGGRLIALRIFPVSGESSERLKNCFEEHWRHRSDIHKYPHRSY